VRTSSIVWAEWSSLRDEGNVSLTVFVHTAPRPVRNGLISAVILSAGLAVALGAGFVDAYLRQDISVSMAGQTMHRATYTRTVAQALVEVGVHLLPKDEVSAPRGARRTEDLSIMVRHAVPVTLLADGQIVSLETAAGTVGDLLSRQNMLLSDDDRVFPDPDTPLVAGMAIRVARIEHRLMTEQRHMPDSVYTSRDPAAPRGMRKIIQPGRIGLKERLFRTTAAASTMVRKQLVAERLRRTPLDRVVRVGTVVQSASRGPFAGREYLDMVATAYAPFCCLGVNDVTSTGMKAGYGVVAVDPTVISLGSRLYVEGYGYAIAGDVGSSIKGLRIDLGFNTRREALLFGVRRIRVHVIATK